MQSVDCGPMRLLRPLALACAAAAAACAPEPVPAVLSFPDGDYARAFDAALEAARAQGMEPVVADRTLGVIETDARPAGSLLEPWRTDNDGLADAFAHTVNFERRRARFEFVPEGFVSVEPAAGDPALGPAIAGSDRAESRLDISRHRGTIELRTWVFVDRAFRANQQIGRWSLSEQRYAQDPADRPLPEDESTRAPTEWTPIGRDVPYERRLTARIVEAMAATPKPAEPATAPAAATDADR